MAWLADNWLFHLVNYLLAAVGYTMLGRFLLSLFVPTDWDNYIWRFFRRLTDPFLIIVRRITPRSVGDGLLPLVAFFWILFLRCLIRHTAALGVVLAHPGIDTLLVYLYFLARCMVDIVLVDIGLLS